MEYKKILNAVGWILALIGFIGFIGGAVISTFYKYELPLGDVEGIVVSKDERMYLGLPFYRKIQSYDSQGKFLKNWNVDSFGGAFRLDIKNDTIIVAIARGNYLIKYDLEGKKLSLKCINDIYSKYENSNQFCYKLNHKTFKINKGLLFPSVVRHETGGQTQKIISIPIILKIFNAPLPAWLFLFLGIIVLFSANKEKMMKKMNQSKLR